MVNRVSCTQCEHIFNPNNHIKCPNCKTSFDRDKIADLADSVNQKFQQQISESIKNLMPAERMLIEAQNRTTQAVRSLAITFVAAPIIFIVLSIVLVLAISSGSTGFILITSIVTLLICIFTLLASLSALAKSKIPDHFG